MNLVHSSAKVIAQKPGIQGVYEQIEKAGRLAYKSEDNITYDLRGNSTSAEKFVSKLIRMDHLSPLEHGTVYLHLPKGIGADSYQLSPYCTCYVSEDGGWDITTNYRFMYEAELLQDLKYICEPSDGHERRITADFICDRGISHEFVRHRAFSFLMESQRYCNYTKSKFNNIITFVMPYWYTEETPKEARLLFDKQLLDAEKAYLMMINEYKLKPEEARAILPNATKTELLMTGTESQWNEFFRLRCAKSAHPDAQKLANKLKEIIS